MDNELWAAPFATSPVFGMVDVPGSKSITNRALVIAALSTNTSIIKRPLVARDTNLMLIALSKLGVGVTQSNGTVTIEPNEFRGPATIDCGLAGTVMRFIPPLAGLTEGHVYFDGDAGARGRPLSELIDALQQLGVVVDDGDRGVLPFCIVGKGSVPGGQASIDSSRSSQFISGLLLSAARFESGAELTHTGPPLPSLPHINMTIDMLRSAGAWIDYDLTDPCNARFTVRPGQLDLGDFDIEPDLSNAAAYLAAAMVTAGSVKIPGWPLQTTQPGDQIRGIFEQMGGSCILDGDELTVTRTGSLSGIDADLRGIGELTPTISAVALFADSPSKLTGIAHLRGHETNRLAALVTEIERLGGSAHEIDDGIVIEPAVLQAADVETYHDHRMATFGAIVGLAVNGVRVHDIGTTAKTLPSFANDWSKLVESPGFQ